MIAFWRLADGSKPVCIILAAFKFLGCSVAIGLERQLAFPQAAHLVGHDGPQDERLNTIDGRKITRRPGPRFSTNRLAPRSEGFAGVDPRRIRHGRERLAHISRPNERVRPFRPKTAQPTVGKPPRVHAAGNRVTGFREGEKAGQAACGQRLPAGGLQPRGEGEDLIVRRNLPSRPDGLTVANRETLCPREIKEGGRDGFQPDPVVLAAIRPRRELRFETTDDFEAFSGGASIVRIEIPGRRLRQKLASLQYRIR
jgi:hypothetical protein